MKTLKMNECIINGRDICPHKILSGKLCSYCKIPDEKAPMGIVAIYERAYLDGFQGITTRDDIFTNVDGKIRDAFRYMWA